MSVKVEVRQFGRPEYKPGDRGVVIEALRPGGAGSWAFSYQLPAVYLTDNGDVEIGNGRYPAADFLEWLNLVRAEVSTRVGEQS